MNEMRSPRHDAQAARRLVIGPATRPAFARWARLHEDRARERLVILAPERAYQIDAIGSAVLKLCDGSRSVADIVADLAKAYAAPADLIGRDVAAMLQGLADKRLLRDGPDAFAPPPLGEAARAYAPFPGGPAGLLAELTHRCPLQCPYCSNPLEMERASAEMSAQAWGDVFRQGAAMGVLQLHLSGGEPTARRDLPEILAQAVAAGLYTNLITAGVLLTRELSATARRHRPRSCPALDPGRRARQRRPDLRLQGRSAQEARRRALGARVRPGPDHQRADASPEHRASARHHRLRAASRTRSASRSRISSTTPGPTGTAPR